MSPRPKWRTLRRLRCHCGVMFSQTRRQQEACPACASLSPQERRSRAEASEAWQVWTDALSVALAPFYGRPEVGEVIGAVYRAFAIPPRPASDSGEMT